jgi:SAM-dependent methyltransferase
VATGAWRNFPRVYATLRPPLRPSPGDVDNLRTAIAGDARVLLLGVTPELSVLGTQLTAVDSSPAMLARIWPGDRPNRRAMLGDWTDLRFSSATFDAVIGDGSLNSAPEQVEEVIAEARRVLAPGGKAAFRLFCAPESHETLDTIRTNVANGWSGNFHALKWRIAMSLARSRPHAAVPVQEILAAFNRLFPDRAALADATGWPAGDISTIDAYAGAGHSLGFPTLSAFLGLLERRFSRVSVCPGAAYPLAERCPTVICGR